MSYLGEDEFRTAMASLKEKLKAAASLNTALPCTADATYRNRTFGVVPTTVTLEKFNNRYDLDKGYVVDITVSLPKCKVTRILKTGSRDEILEWLGGFEKNGDGPAFLTEFYRALTDLNEDRKLI